MLPSTFHIAICDDTPADTAQICDMARLILERAGIVYTIDSFSASRALFECLRRDTQRYHMLLLDIVMDGLDGMQLAQQLRAMGVTAEIIFITFNVEFSLQGYQVDAARFLIKPPVYEKMREALLHSYSQILRRSTVTVSTAVSQQTLPLDQILYAELYGRGSRLFLDNSVLDITEPFSKLKGLFPSTIFIQCHKSYLVNLSHVLGICRYELRLTGGHCVPVSKSQYDRVRALLMHYVTS